jgi:hypothetical protein
VANRLPPAAKEAAFRIEVVALDEAAEKLVPERIARGA